jgi:uncharacterized RDD family membrane protein YckC
MARLIINPTASNRREVPLSRTTIVTIGRDPGNDLVLPDAMVSRRHAVVECRGGQFFLRDLSSANGSIVNGDRVSERGLRDGDLVAIGSMRLLFREEPAEPGAKVVPHPSVPRLHCPSCGSEYRRGDLFCRECGTLVGQPSGPATATCDSCGATVPLPARYCSACGASLAGEREPGGSADPVEGMDKAAGAGERPVPERSADEARPVLGSQAPATAPVPRPALPPPQRRAQPATLKNDRAPVPRERRPERSRQARVGGDAAPGGFGSRLVAGLIDAVFVLSGQAVMLAPVYYYWWSRGASPGDVPFLPIVLSVTLVALAVLLGLLYHVYFWGVRGATPGKELLDLRVEREDGAAPIGLGRAALRAFGYLLSAASLGVGFLMIAVAGEGLHDRVAGTRVVKGRR